MPGPQYRHRLIVVLFLLLTMVGCRQEERVNRDAPNGPYFDRLDSAGKRVAIYDQSGNLELKVRRMSRRFKVYSQDTLAVLGSISERERGLVIETVDGTVTPLESGPDTMTARGRLSVERVTDGWAILNVGGETLGYIAETSEGTWAFRDDYSSQPRLRVKRDGARLVIQDGSQVVYYTYDRKLTPPELLALTLDGLDPLSRTALARWLAGRHSES